MTLGDRLKQLRKMQKMSQVEFGSRIGVSGATISTSESGKTNPDEQTIRAICSEFNVSRTWLETGEGQPYVQTELVPELMHALQKYPELRATLERVIPRMDEEDWQALDRLLGKLKNPTE